MSADSRERELARGAVAGPPNSAAVKIFPEARVGLSIFELQGTLLICRHHRDAGVDLAPHLARDALSRLGLTQADAARLLGIDDRTSRRWARHGTRGTSEILLRLLLAGRIPPADIHYARRYRPS